MTKPNLIITGSTGLLGSAIAEELYLDYNIIGIDIKRPLGPSYLSSFYETDMTSLSSIKKTLDMIYTDEGCDIDSFIHLAAYYDFTGKPSPLYQELTVDGTKKLLQQLHEKKFNVKQFIFSSSHLVMKSAQKGQIITEDDDLEATWDYPLSSIEAEKVIKKYHKDIPVVILRIAGAYDDQGHCPPICQQIKRIYERQFDSHLYPGDKDKGQPFVHIDDIVSIFRACIVKKDVLKTEEVFLVPGQELLSYEELQDRIGYLLYGTEWETYFIPKFIAKAGAWAQNLKGNKNTFIKPWMIDLTDTHYPLSFKKAQQKLNWYPHHRLYETLPIIIRNLLKNPVKWYYENHLGEPPAIDIKKLRAQKRFKELNRNKKMDSA